MNWRCLFREFLGRSDAFDISCKGDGIENGLSDTLVGEMPRVPATYGERMRPEFEEQISPVRVDRVNHNIS